MIIGLLIISLAFFAVSLMYYYKMWCFRSKIDISLALNKLADHHSKREPLLAPVSDIGHDIIIQNTSRRFLYNNPKKIYNLHMPLEVKY